KTASAKRKVPWTIRGERQPGRIWRTRTRWWDIPCACAASTNCLSRRERVRLRSTRARRGVYTIVRAVITLNVLGPSADIRATREHNTRERHQAIHHPHNRRIETPKVASEEAHTRAAHGREGGHEHADLQRQARAPDGATEHVAAQVVRA